MRFTFTPFATIDSQEQQLTDTNQRFLHKMQPVQAILSGLFLSVVLLFGQFVQAQTVGTPALCGGVNPICSAGGQQAVLCIPGDNNYTYSGANPNTTDVQWQFSSDNVNWSNTSNTTFSYTATTPGYYRYVVNATYQLTRSNYYLQPYDCGYDYECGYYYTCNYTCGTFHNQACINTCYQPRTCHQSYTCYYQVYYYENYTQGETYYSPSYQVTSVSPSASNITQSGSLSCIPLGGSTNVTYSATLTGGATTITWTVPTWMTIVSGQNSTSITVSVNQSAIGATASGNVTATGYYNTCTTGANSLAVSATGGTAATITPGSATTFCSGGSLTLTASSGSSYIWSTTATAQIIAVTQTGNYSVTVKNSQGCSTTSAATSVTVNPLPTVAAISGGNAVCAGSILQLTDATSGGTWTSTAAGVATVDNTGKVTGVSAGTAVISYNVTNANSCTTTVTNNVTVNALPVVAAISGGNAVCVGSILQLTDATSGGTWTSTAAGVATVDNTGKVTGASAGTSVISYKVTNASNCTTIVSNNVTVNALPVVAAITGANSVCAGSTIQLDNTTTAGTWSSSNSAVLTVDNTGKVTGVATGIALVNYTVTTNGCATTLSSSILVNTLPVATITATGPTTFCAGGSVTLKSTGSSLGDALNFNGNNQYVNVTPTASINSLGLTGYTLEAWVYPTDVSGVKSILRKTGDYNLYIIDGSVAAEVWPNGIGNSTFIRTTPIASNVIPNNAWSHVAATWNKTTGIISLYVNGVNVSSSTLTTTIGGTEPLLIGLSSIYNQPFAGKLDEVRIWDTVRSATQVANSRNSFIASNTPHLAAYYKFDEGTGTTTADATGKGNNGTLINSPTWVIPSDVPVTYSNYLWTPGSATTSSINVVSTGSYTLKVTDANNCTATSTPVSVTVNPVPNAPTGTDNARCGTGTVAISATPGAGEVIDWYNAAASGSIVSGGTATNSFTTPSISTTTTYFAQARNTTTGCVSATRTAVTATINAFPVVAAITGTTSVCISSTTQLSNTTGGGAWSSNAAGVAAVNSSGLVSGINNGTAVITYTVTSASNCVTSVTTAVTVKATPSPTIFAATPTTFCGGSASTLVASGNAITFNGANYTEVVNNNLPLGNASRTMEAWIKTTGDGAIANWGQIATSQRFGLLVVAGRLYFVGENNDQIGNITINDGIWHHVAVSFDGATVKLYVDGVQDVTASKTLNTTNSTLRFGRRAVGDAQTEYFTGSIDEVRIWNVARTQSQLQAAKNSEIDASTTGLVAYYKLNEASGSISADATANHITTTLFNSPTFAASGSGVGYAGYLWSPGGATTQTISATASGNYTVTVTNAEGCSATSPSVAVTATPLATATVSKTDVLCAGGSTGTITVTAAGGTTPYQYSKDGGTTFQGSNIFSGLAAATYSIVVKSNTSCVSASQPVTVSTVPDVTKPVPDVATLPVITGECSAGVSSAPTATDNCVGTVIGTTVDPVSYTSQGTHTITWSYDDGHGNIQTQTQTIIVKDVTPPVIVCAPAQTVTVASGQCNATIVVVSPTVTDNCSGYSSNNGIDLDGQNDYITIGNQLASNSSYTKEAWLYTKSTNASGNIISADDFPFWIENNQLSASNSFQHGDVTLRDPNQFPVAQWTHVAVTYDAPTHTMKIYKNGIVVASRTNALSYLASTLSLGQYQNGNFLNSIMDEVRIWNIARTSAEINANMNVALTGSPAGLVSRYSFDQGTAGGNNTSILTLTNNQGNSAYNGTITNVARTGATSNFVSGAPALSGLVLNNSFNNTANASGTYPIGTTNVVWTATDAVGNQSTCTQVITVNAPEINLTGNTVSIVKGSASPSTTDNTDFGGTLPSVPVTKTFTIQNTGTSALTVSSIGVSGTNAANFTVSAISFPATVAANASATFNVIFNATAVGVKAATITVSNTDCDEASYNFAVTAEITCTIPVFANTNPHLSGFTSTSSCNATISYGLSVSGIPTPVLSYVFTGATTGSGSGTGSGQLFNKGITNVTVSATNACGTVTNNFDVTITDNVTPTITAPAAVAVNNDADKCGATITLGTPVTNDNCGVASVTNNGASFTTGGLYPVGVTTVTWTVTDNSGLTATATQTITVTDNQKPVITVPVNISVNNDAAKCGATISVTAPASTDNCGVATTVGVRSDELELTADYPVGTTTITWTVTDIHGNTETSTQNITVTDTEKPVITTVDQTQTADNNDCGANVTVAAPVTGDNCGVQSVTNNYNGTADASGHYPVGTTTVLWTVTDIHGNRNTVTQTVTVNDTQLPIVHTQNVTVQLDANGAAYITTAQVNNNSTDNCGIATYSLDKTSFDCSNVGANTVILTVTDTHGNLSTGAAVVTVEDNILPTAVTKNLTVQLNANGTVTITPAQVNNGSADNCGIATYSLDKTSFDCSNVGMNTVNLTVTDAHGNASTAAATVTVEDKVAPTVITQNITVQLDANGSVMITPAQINSGSTDNCTIASYSLDKTSFDCTNVGANTVTLTVTDVNGNSSSKTATVTVADNIAPTVLTQNITVQLDANGSATITPSQINNGSTDNCSIATYSLDKASFNCSNTGVNTITLTVKDVNGNMSSKTATVTVVDNIAPVLSAAPANVIVECNAVPAPAVLTATDNCSGTTVAMVETRTNGTCPDSYTLNRTWTATDASGNRSSVSQTITVQDTQAPVLSAAPGDVTVECNAVPGAAVLTATDNCATPNVEFTQTSTQNQNPNSAGYYNYTITRKWTATDGCGNTSSKTQVITVRDTQKPVVVCPEVAASCNNQSGNSKTVTLTATDNCGPVMVTYSLGGATILNGGTGTTLTQNFNVGTTQINWVVKDVTGNTSTCTTTVVINALPVAGITAATADAFCNSFVLTGNSTLNGPFTYQWLFNNQSASSTQQLTLGLTNADGVYTLYTTDGNGCRSAVGATYNYQKQNLVSSYTILAYKEVDMGKYNKVLSGSVGVMTAKGEAEFKAYSSVTGAGSFVKSPVIDKDGSGIVLTSVIGVAIPGLPTMQYNTADTRFLANYNATQNNAVLTANYHELNVKKGVSVTVTGNTFGSIRLEEGASIRFTNPSLSIDNLTADKGAKNVDYSYIRFAPNTSVKVSGKVSIGSQVLLNPESNKVTIYMGDLKNDEEKFTVKGGDTRVIANVYMPDGKLRVTATDSDDDNHESCDHKAHNAKDCKHKGHDHNDCDHRAHSASSCSDDVYMTGLFIAEEIESKGNTVIWNNYDCSAPAVIVTNSINTAANAITVETKAGSVVTEEELKVTVMPNPTTTFFTLKFESKYETPISMRVMDGRGRVVDAKSKIGANSTIQIGHNYSSGTYYAELIQGTQRKVVQLIKGKG
jgi:hypothetical protein